MLEPTFHPTKWFSQNLLATETNKIKVKIKKPIYLGLPMSETSNTVIYTFSCVESKYDNKADLCYMDKNSFIVNIETDVYKNIANDAEKQLDTSNY